MSTVSVPTGSVPRVKPMPLGGIGDLNSDAPGSGARFNAGKPPMDLLAVRFIAEFYGSDDPGALPEVRVLYRLADWQETGDPRYLIQAAKYLGPEVLKEAAHVLDYGRGKYAEWNWAKGMPWSVPLACAVRHLMEALDGQRDDAESHRTHVGHVMCNLLMLHTYVRVYPQGNDLPAPLKRL